MTPLESAGAFMYRNARPLDLARWQYHFEGGSREAVLQALSFYQNADGGFGHALEPDCWNPHSTPIQTWTATEILREIGCTDASHPIVQGILHYLASGRDFDGAVWFNAVRSNNAYPHAPWWHAEADSADSYNPTACLAGFLIRFAGRGSELYALGCRIAREAFFADEERGLSSDMHSILLYIRLLEYCREAGELEAVDLAALEDRLREQIPRSLTHNTVEWENGYVCTPSRFFCKKDSVFYEENKALAEYECEFLLRTQREDGAWDIPWKWSAYPEQWPVARLWWRGNGAIHTLLYLRGMGKV